MDIESFDITSDNDVSSIEIQIIDQKLLEEYGEILIPQYVEPKEDEFCYSIYNDWHLLRKKIFKELRIAIAGNVDAGKSSTMGVISRDQIDDGKGLARSKIFKHKHEAESGRTSSITHEVIGFDEKGNVIRTGKDKKLAKFMTPTMIIFSDLAGHEKYVRTTLRGISSQKPDYVVIMVSANNGIVGMTKEHYTSALILKIPIIIIYTKIDMTPKNIYDENLQKLKDFLKKKGSDKIPFMINGIGDVIDYINSDSQRLTPIISISNKTMEGHDKLMTMFKLLRKRCEEKKDEILFTIDRPYMVKGVGTVVSGILFSGKIKIGDELFIGPTKNVNEYNSFLKVTVKGIHINRVEVNGVEGEISCSFAVKGIKKKDIKRNMICVKKPLKSYTTFKADILVFCFQTSITPGYQAVIHIGNVAQSVKIDAIEDSTFLRSGSRATVTFKFMVNAEVIEVGQRLIFREGKMRGNGIVKELLF